MMALCFAVLTMELYDQVSDAPRESWRHVLLAAQDPKTGLFVDPLFSRDDLDPTSPGEDYVLHQTTYFALNALDALGSRSHYPLHFVKPFCDITYLEGWLEGLDWFDPWKESNWVMFIAAALYITWQWESDRLTLRALHHLLDWLDVRQDPGTGFWGIQEGASLLDAMAAAYHFLPFYFCLDRPIHFPEAMIESTLSLQQPDGLFHPDGGGDTCLDVDAVDILVKCSLLTSYLADRVEDALERAYYGIQDSQGADGGFCRARRRPRPPKSLKRRIGETLRLDRLLRMPYAPPQEVWNYSGWTRMPFDIRRSDLWSTWFRSYGLAVIGVRYPEKFAPEAKWRFRRIPVLGWHDVTQIVRYCTDVGRTGSRVGSALCFVS
jgi:hypothetical protein